MNKFLLTLLWAGMLSSATLSAQSPSELSIIPEPLKIEMGSGEFAIDQQTQISIKPDTQEMRLLAGMLADQLDLLGGRDISITTDGDGAGGLIQLSLEPDDSMGEEAYVLSVSPEQVHLKASGGGGIFYGLQTLFQLLPTQDDLALSGQPLLLPALRIEDEPRYAWRGMMLDVGRFFYPVPFIKKFIDYLAMHKMNVFHWHLTEDHGWRLEIDQYPRLTQVSAWREATQITPGGRMDHNLHGGYYTRDQVREVVQYAQDRYVTVVPEIEMPGHALSALIAYPELSCIEGPFEFPERWAIQENIYCAGNEQTFEFLENVLTEVVELFPSPIIHIGGGKLSHPRQSR